MPYGKSTLCSQCWLACSLAGGGCYLEEWTSRYLPVLCTGRWDCRHLPSSVPEQQKWGVTQTLKLSRNKSCGDVQRTKAQTLWLLRKLAVVLENSWPRNQVLHGAGTQVNAVSELQLAALYWLRTQAVACVPSPSHISMPWDSHHRLQQWQWPMLSRQRSLLRDKLPINRFFETINQSIPPSV